MRYDDHFGQLKIFSKKVYLFVWNVLLSMMFQIYFGIIHQIPIDKMNLKKNSFLILKRTKTLFCPNKFNK